MHDIVRGDKHNVRISANRNAQISVIHSAYCLTCALQFADFSSCVCHLEQLHAQSSPLFPIVFDINMFPFLLFSQYLLSFHYFARVCAALLRPLHGRNFSGLWFCQLGFGVSLRGATSNLPSSPNSLSNRNMLHDGRKHKTVNFSQSSRSMRK